MMPAKRRRQAVSDPPNTVQRGMQEFWLAALRHKWRSMALIPAHSGGNVDKLARALVDMGQRYRGRPLNLILGHNLTLENMAPIVDLIERTHARTPEQRRGEQEIVVALDPVLENPFGVAVAMAVDAVVLVAELGRTDLSSANKSLEALGRDRVIGVVAVKPEKTAKK
jgi:hypothetical protein